MWVRCYELRSSGCCNVTQTRSIIVMLEEKELTSAQKATCLPFYVVFESSIV